VGEVYLLDLGNRRLKWAPAEGSGQWGKVSSVSASEAPDLVAELAKGADLFRMSSVNPESATLVRQAIGAVPMKEVGVDGWPLRVQSEGTGADRVTAAFAAHQRSQGASLVADFGTAWTLDVVDHEGVFRGGAIGPGLGLAESALHEAAPHLGSALVDWKGEFPTSTPAALAVGTVGALVLSIEALATRWASELKLEAPSLFLTGGDAERLAPWFSAEWTCVPELVLDGLARWNPR